MLINIYEHSIYLIITSNIHYKFIKYMHFLCIFYAGVKLMFYGYNYFIYYYSYIFNIYRKHGWISIYNFTGNF